MSASCINQALQLLLNKVLALLFHLLVSVNLRRFRQTQCFLREKVECISSYDSFALNVHTDSTWHRFRMTMHANCLCY